MMSNTESYLEESWQIRSHIIMNHSGLYVKPKRQNAEQKKLNNQFFGLYWICPLKCQVAREVLEKFNLTFSEKSDADFYENMKAMKEPKERRATKGGISGGKSMFMTPKELENLRRNCKDWLVEKKKLRLENKIKPKEGLNREDIGAMMALKFEDGHRAEDLAVLFDVCERTIRRYCKEFKEKGEAFINNFPKRKLLDYLSRDVMDGLADVVNELKEKGPVKSDYEIWLEKFRSQLSKG